MQSTKNTGFLLVILGVVFFAAGFVQAGGVTEEWVARYNGPTNDYDVATDIAVDSSGNVYVTGINNVVPGPSDPEYATIKYDSNGNQKWVARYNGPGDDLDYAYAIALDSSGNVYVTGYTATIKYDPNGNQMWVVSYNGLGDFAQDIAVDSSGNVYVTGSATIKYDPNGNQKWVAHYNGLGNNIDGACAIALDGSGNVYITGVCDQNFINFPPTPEDSSDYATIKYDPNGNQMWVARYNGDANGYDSASDIAVDSSGNVYVTGYSAGDGTSWDYATIKYDTNGNQKWVARYNGPGNNIDYAYAIALDGSGNVYVTGVCDQSISFPPEDSGDYATIKYDPNGNQMWVARYNGDANGYDSASDIAVDSSGNVYVTGLSYCGRGYNDFDYTTIKYDTNGNQKWVAWYNGPGNNIDGASAIALDNSGNVYVTGRSAGSYDTLDDYATIKYSQCEYALAGDLNGDCRVDFYDFARMASNWLIDCKTNPNDPACVPE